jgi:putative transposase
MSKTGVRFSATPTANQQAKLRVWIGHQRFVKNAKAREAEYWRTFGRKALALTGEVPLPDQAYAPFIGPDSQFLREVPPQVLRNGAYRFAIAQTRFLKGLGGAPKVQPKHGRQSVLLTSELFEFREVVHPATGEVRYDLYIGTTKFPLGRLRFKAHCAYERPNSLVISVEPDNKWFVSFCYEMQAVLTPGQSESLVLRTPDELVYEFSLRTDEELARLTVGLDRGIAIPLAASTGQSFKLDPVCLNRIDKKERAARRYQRSMARQVLGSKNRNKNRTRKARCQSYAKHVRQDFAHKASHALVSSVAEIFVFEDLKLKNMTKAPAPKQDAKGCYTRNGAAAKAALSKGLLSSALGSVKLFTSYKAARCNKLVLSVSPYNSSNECAQCGHTELANRLSQAEFGCVKCQHRDNADHNASCVLKKRGIVAIRACAPVKKKPKKTARVGGKTKVQRQRDMVGPVRPEPGG